VVTSVRKVVDHDKIGCGGDDKGGNQRCIGVGAGAPSHYDAWEEARPDGRAGNSEECDEEDTAKDELEDVFEEGEMRCARPRGWFW